MRCQFRIKDHTLKLDLWMGAPHDGGQDAFVSANHPSSAAFTELATCQEPTVS